MNSSHILRAVSCVAVFTYVGTLVAASDKEFREDESAQREIDFQRFIEEDWGPGIVTEQRVEGDEHAWGEIAFEDRVCDFNYGINQGDFSRFDRQEYEISCES